MLNVFVAKDDAGEGFDFDVLKGGALDERAKLRIWVWANWMSSKTSLTGIRRMLVVIIDHYRKFQTDLPELCAVLGLEPND